MRNPGLDHIFKCEFDFKVITWRSLVDRFRQRNVGADVRAADVAEVGILDLALLADKRVRAALADERIAAAVADQRVVAVAAVQDIGVGLGDRFVRLAFAWRRGFEEEIRVGVVRRVDLREVLSEPAVAVLVEVQDSGVGIAPENLERIFEAFYTTRKDGMGMGLSICRTIIEAHGGTLSAESNKDKGTTFRFTLKTATAA